ncbi:MAG: NosD domain-containing protein, partial [Verrucomicrobiota bacterium]
SLCPLASVKIEASDGANLIVSSNQFNSLTVAWPSNPPGSANGSLTVAGNQWPAKDWYSLSSIAVDRLAGRAFRIEQNSGLFKLAVSGASGNRGAAERIIRGNRSLANLRLVDVSGVTIESNHFSTVVVPYLPGEAALTLDRGVGNRIQANQFEGRDTIDGITFWDPSPDGGLVTQNEVLNNRISGFKIGMFLMAGTSNVISGNLFRSNSFVNLKIGSASGSASGNLIYNNAFIARPFTINKQILLGGCTGPLCTNYLNLPQPQAGSANILLGDRLAGNFYSDYAGDDLDFDGIGDSPRSFGATAVDLFPLRPRLIVNLADDREDADPFDGIADVDSEQAGLQTSLRAALLEASRLSGPKRIRFEIPGEPRISIQKPLASVRQLILNGTNSPSGARVHLDGAQAATNTYGLSAAEGSEIRHLIITSFPSSGILLSGGEFDTNIVENCFIGCTPEGLPAAIRERASKSSRAG